MIKKNDRLLISTDFLFLTKFGLHTKMLFRLGWRLQFHLLPFYQLRLEQQGHQLKSSSWQEKTHRNLQCDIV